MTRTSFRNLWLLVMVIMLGSAWFMFNKAEKTRAKAERQTVLLAELEREKKNAQNLSAALAELDALTINESDTTQLDILRHLELEKSGYAVQHISKQVKMVGSASLYLRKVSLTVEQPYENVLALADKLYNMKKVVLDSVELTPGVGTGDAIDITIEGTLYGLEKR